MSAIEEYRIQRLLTIAQMAATLEAGDRANPDIGVRCDDIAAYARRAVKLFDAVEQAEES